MTERLDRIEALLEGTGENLKQTTAKQAKNTEDIDTLLGAIALSEARIEKLVGKAEDTDTLFNTLRAEAQADRQETRRLWNDAVTQMNYDRAEAKADRDEHARRFDAQQETIQRLLLAVVDLSRDNNRMRDRLDGLERAS